MTLSFVLQATVSFTVNWSSKAGVTVLEWPRQRRQQKTRLGIEIIFCKICIVHTSFCGYAEVLAVIFGIHVSHKINKIVVYNPVEILAAGLVTKLGF